MPLRIYSPSMAQNRLVPSCIFFSTISDKPGFLKIVLILLAVNWPIHNGFVWSTYFSKFSQSVLEGEGNKNKSHSFGFVHLPQCAASIIHL